MEGETRVNKKPKVEEHREKTFVLAYPVFFKASYIGALVSFLEENKFHLQGMMVMDVTKKFIEKHFKNVGAEPEGECPCLNWVDYLSSGPVVAMILEGHEAVQKLNELAPDRDQAFFWSSEGQTAYGSNSAYSAKRDIEMWFGQDSKATERSHLRLKLVRKSEYPDSIVWLDSSASSKSRVDDEYGIAMVVSFLEPKLELRDKAPDLKYIDLKSEVYLVGSNYVYQSKPDEM